MRLPILYPNHNNANDIPSANRNLSSCIATTPTVDISTIYITAYNITNNNANPKIYNIIHHFNSLHRSSINVESSSKSSTVDSLLMNVLV